MGSNIKNGATLYHQFEEKGRANYRLNLRKKGKQKINFIFFPNYYTK